MTKYKLTCFNCRIYFKDKKEVYRTSLNYPFCRECFGDDLLEYWGDEFIEDFLNEVRDKFNGNYNKWLKNFHEVNEPCDICSGEYYDKMYYPKDSITLINGKKYCSGCIDNLEETNHVD